MKIKLSELKRLIHEEAALNERSDRFYSVPDSYRIEGGDDVPYASLPHIDDVEHALNTMIRIRDQQPRGSGGRFACQRACEFLRGQLKKARGIYEKQNPVEEPLNEEPFECDTEILDDEI